MAAGTPSPPSPPAFAFNASSQPMFYAALAFAAGIFFARFQWRPALWWWSAALVLLASGMIVARCRPLPAFVIAMLALVCAGALSAEYQRARLIPSPDIRSFTNREIEITGHVFRAGLLRERERDAVQTFDLQSATIDGQPISAGIRVNAYTIEREGEFDEPAAFTAVQYGERLRLRGRLREPRNFGNPGAMDYRGYLQTKGITALASVKTSKVMRLQGTVGTSLGFWRAKWRKSLVDHMLALQSDGPRWASLTHEDIGLLAAMLIGEQSLIRRDTKTDFQRTGAFHILVVSGMNVGILAFVIFGIAKRLHAGENLATLLTVALSLLYAYVTDLGAPIVRAAIMLSLYLLARLLYRDRYSLNAIGTAALLLLLFAPSSLFEASFQLTFLSVTALGGITQPVIERTTYPVREALNGINILGYDAALAPEQAQLRLDIRMVAERFARVSGFSKELWSRALARILHGGLSLVDLLVVTMLLQLALALPMVYYFHRLALVGLPTNMVVIPLTALLMPLGIAATLLSYVWHAAAQAFAIATALVLHGVTETVAVLGGLRFADLRTATPSPALSLFASAAFALCVFMMRRRRIVAVVAIAVLVASTVLLTMPARHRFQPGTMEITIIDVGQGDSILLVSPEGRTLLVDGGGPPGFVRSDAFDIGEDVVSAYLWSRGISGLDAVALSHAHSDHMTGLRSIIANFRPRELWVGIGSDTPAYASLLTTARDFDTQVVERSAGQSFRFGGAEIRLLAPVRGRKPKHNESLVLHVKYRDTSALLTGDAERDSELEIAAAAAQADLLKVAHHGSATSTRPELLSAVQPEFAAISVGHQNFYGHPKAEIVQRLTAARVRTLRTDLHGALTFYLDGKQVTAKTFAESH